MWRCKAVPVAGDENACSGEEYAVGILLLTN